MTGEEPNTVLITDGWDDRLRTGEIVTGYPGGMRSFPYSDKETRIHALMNARNLAASLVRGGTCTTIEDEL